MESHFAAYKHKSGIMMISIDSLVGYIRRLPDDHQYTLEDFAELLEEFLPEE